MYDFFQRLGSQHQSQMQRCRQLCTSNHSGHRMTELYVSLLKSTVTLVYTVHQIILITISLNPGENVNPGLGVLLKSLGDPLG